MLLQNKLDEGKSQLEEALQVAQSSNDEAIAAQVKIKFNYTFQFLYLAFNVCIVYTLSALHYIRN